MIMSHAAATLIRGETINLERAFNLILTDDPNAEYYFEGLTGDLWDSRFDNLDSEALIEYSNFYQRTGICVVGFYVKAWENVEYDGRMSVLFKG